AVGEVGAPAAAPLVRLAAQAIRVTGHACFPRVRPVSSGYRVYPLSSEVRIGLYPVDVVPLGVPGGTTFCLWEAFEAVEAGSPAPEVVVPDRLEGPRVPLVGREPLARRVRSEVGDLVADQVPLLVDELKRQLQPCEQACWHHVVAVLEDPEVFRCERVVLAFAPRFREDGARISTCHHRPVGQPLERKPERRL